MSTKKMKPIHPGEILLHEFLMPNNLSQTKLANDIGVSPRRINEIVLEKRSLTANTALRLAKYFKMSPEFWMGLQVGYDLETERDKFGDALDREVGEYQENVLPGD
jgi:antitoxin HigA-1